MVILFVRYLDFKSEKLMDIPQLIMYTCQRNKNWLGNYTGSGLVVNTIGCR